jgi:DNA-binding HxlR family transcriptional regulator
MVVLLSVLFLYQMLNSVNNRIKSSGKTTAYTGLEPLIALCHHRWSIPVLAELERDQGAKFVTLVNRLNISRDALSRTLKALQQQGFVMRNPGYGHPLRPEYILTTSGQRVGPPSLALMHVIHQNELEDVMLKKWALPIIHALRHQPVRFSDLLQLPLTARALSLTSRELEGTEMIEASYQLTRKGKRIAKLLEILVANLNVTD